MQPDAALAGALAERLRQAVGLSQRMLQSATAGDWSTVATLEVERADLLDQPTLAACRRLTHESRGGVGELLSQCLRLNDELAALTALHLRHLDEIIVQHQGGSSAGAEPPASAAGGG